MIGIAKVENFDSCWPLYYLDVVHIFSEAPKTTAALYDAHCPVSSRCCLRIVEEEIKSTAVIVPQLYYTGYY